MLTALYGSYPFPAGEFQCRRERGRGRNVGRGAAKLSNEMASNIVVELGDLRKRDQWRRAERGKAGRTAWGTETDTGN